MEILFTLIIIFISMIKNIILFISFKSKTAELKA